MRNLQKDERVSGCCLDSSLPSSFLLDFSFYHSGGVLSSVSMSVTVLGS